MIDMQRIKRTPALLVLALLLVMLPLAAIPGSSTAGGSSGIVIDDHQLVVEEITPMGEVKSVQVVDWLSLDGNGTITVDRPSDLAEKPKVKGVSGFTTPEVTDDGQVWKDVQVSGNKMLVTTNMLSDESAEVELEKLPLETEWRYWLDDEVVEDLNDIAGESGHFRMELHMKNTSKKKTEVTYTDSITGEEVVESVETYLPIVIQPYDWYFYNTVFSNMETDHTSVMFYNPTFFQPGWSIPLFPPATEDTHAIWIEADVKDFALDPLTLAVAFVLPETNQHDPLPEFTDGLTELYGGVEQLGAGLAEAVLGLGDTGMSDTLLYGINQISGGLVLMASTTDGLPYARYNINSQMVPGVDQMTAGIGSATAPDTLLYGVNAITGGLQEMEAGIGTQETPDTLLYGTNAITQGLGEMLVGIGSAATPDTLLYAVGAMIAGMNDSIAGIDDLVAGVGDVKAGLSTGDPANPGIKEGLQQISDGLGVATNPATIIGGLSTMATNMDPANPASIYAAVAGISAQMKASSGGIYDYVNGIPVADLAWGAVYLPNINALMAAYTGTLDPTAVGIQQMYNGLTAALPNGIIPNLQYMKMSLDTMVAGIGTDATPDTMLNGLAQIEGGLAQMKAGIGSATTLDTLLYAAQATYDGLSDMASGIGDVATPDTLLYGTNAITGGLVDMLAGIGSAQSPDTLLYGSSAVFSGLSLLQGNLSTGSMANPGLREGLVQIGDGLGDAVTGLGSFSTPDTLIYGAGQIEGGLGELKAGLEEAVSQGTDVMQEGLTESINELDLTQGELAAIAERGENFDNFIGRVENPDSESDVRLLIQTQPIQSKSAANGWIIALVLSILAALLLVGAGIFAYYRLA
ncbi:MAG: hypothetical protein KKB90_07290 [Actinobacteria bacterium]|nr:hypothetical protein [Actinomycetota bacterium]MCG2819935.1 hypothetical protein [Actinomycetes bacterium]MBU4218754.1 hypothetical protein [Actinomycetota bacterium]MBU4359527.1 hypothetical protein [Actinomycetota bacterium]MBU4391735.1 hypothetical protein [Actinomycetota bacterium]